MVVVAHFGAARGIEIGEGALKNVPHSIWSHLDAELFERIQNCLKTVIKPVRK